MKNLTIFTAVAISIFLQSCASIAPSVPNVIIPQEKGEINLSGAIGLPNLSANASLAVSKNIAVVSSINGSLGLLGDTRLGYEGGLQFSKFLSKNVAISATPSYSFGNWENVTHLIITDITSKGNWNAKSLFVQGQYFFTNEKENKLSIGGGLRATYTTQNEQLIESRIGKPMYATSVEPIGMLIMEHKSFGMFLMGGLDIQPKTNKENEIMERSPIILSAGINFKLGSRK
jgi:hypothetical protein